MTTTTRPPRYSGVALELPTEQWVQLDMVYPAFYGPYPSRIKFDGGRVRIVQSWREAYGHVVSWLVSSDKIDAVVEVKGSSGRYIVNETPIHTGGEHFKQPFELPNGWWLEVGGPEPLQFERILELLKRFDVDTQLVEVMLEHRDDPQWN